MQASQNYKRNENQSNVRSVIRFIPVVPLPNWHRLSRIWNDKLQIGVDVEARQTPTAERGNVGGRGYCLTVLHYIIGMCVCVRVCAMWRVCRIDFPLWHACHVVFPAARPPRHVVPAAAAAAAPADISWPPFVLPSLPPLSVGSFVTVSMPAG